MKATNHDVIGIGNAIVDVLCRVDESFLSEHGLIKGAMTLIDTDVAERLYATIRAPVQRSGGSAANTMVGIASFGGRAAYAGKVADDELGHVFVADLGKAGVASAVRSVGVAPPTGRCLVFVTSDAQRTMQTFLGASATLQPADIDPGAVAGAEITYLEGYLFDPPPAKEAFFRAAQIAHEAGRRVALSLSDPFCVERHRKQFLELVEGHVDILFANEDEIVALYESAAFDEAVQRVAGSCEIAALTRGALGSVVIADRRTIEVPAAPVERVVDTTGAGDLFAAGFLYGLTAGEEPEMCGRLGSLAAAEVIAHVGARPQIELASLHGHEQGE